MTQMTGWKAQVVQFSYSRLSTLNINSEYTIFENSHAKDSGGALLVRYGNVTIQGSVSFVNNYAYVGGAISLLETTLVLNGNALFTNNEAFQGGAVSFLESYIHVSGDWLNIKPFCVSATSFCWNMVTNRESIRSYSLNTWDCYGNRCGSHDSFHTDIAPVNVSTEASILCSNLSSQGRIEFRENSAWAGGGAIKGQYQCWIGIRTRILTRA